MARDYDIFETIGKTLAKAMIVGLPVGGVLLTREALKKRELESKQEEALKAALHLFPELRKYDPRLLVLHAKSFATLNPEMATDPMLLASFLKSTLAIKGVDPAMIKTVSPGRVSDITERILLSLPEWVKS